MTIWWYYYYWIIIIIILKPHRHQSFLPEDKAFINFDGKIVVFFFLVLVLEKIEKGKAKDQEKDAYVTQYQVVCPLWQWMQVYQNVARIDKQWKRNHYKT